MSIPGSDSIALPAARLHGLNLLKIPAESRRPFEGDNARKADRFGEREIERLRASIRTARDPRWIPVCLRDFSQTGFGMVAQGASRNFLPSPGETLELKIEAPWGQTVILPCELRNTPSQAEGLRLGVERIDVRAAGKAGEGRIGLEGDSRVPVRIDSLILYREWNDAELAGFEADGTWIFESDDPGLLLFAGSPLSIHFDLPLETEDSGSGKVAWIRSVSAGRIAFAVTWDSLSFQVSNALGEHLLQKESLSPAGLSRFGIHLKKFREQLRFSVVSSLEEYAQVLDLRRQAYVQAGKVPRETTPGKFASRFDRESRILGAFHGKDLVASLGLTFPKDDGSKLKSEVLFPGGRYPVAVPPKASVMEAHTFCTRPDYRGGDLVRGVFEQVARCLLLSDREWIITLTTADLWPLYRKIGFRKLGASVPVEYFGGLEHHLILLHRDAWICGKGLSPFSWNYFYGDLIRDLESKGYLELSGIRSMRVAAYSLFGKAVRSWSHARLEKDYRIFLEKIQAGRKTHD